MSAGEAAAEAAEEGSEVSGALPLPDDRFSTFELAAHAVLLTAFALPALAYLLDLFAGWPLLWDRIVVDIVAPVIGEAGGDSDYNLLDTVVYALLLASFVFALSAWLRRARLPAHERTLFVFLPWVVWAAMVEVAEDAGLISASIQTLFVSPLIHFQTACWVVLSGALAYYLTRDSDSERTSEMCLRVAVGVMVLHLLFLHDLSGEGAFDLLAGSVGILTILASLPIIRFRGLVSHWSGVEQGVFLSGLTSVALAFGVLGRFGLERAAEGDPAVLWPAWVVLGVPLILCWMLAKRGCEVREGLLEEGVELGVLAPGLTLAAWEDLDGDEHKDAEARVKTAMMASPAVLLAVYGQAADGLATYLGIDHFGYSEKHLLSDLIIKVGNGAWAFLMVKLLLAGFVLLFFMEARFEQRHRHLRLLVLLGLLAVGLAPGLRDLGRLMLGV